MRINRLSLHDEKPGKKHTGEWFVLGSNEGGIIHLAGGRGSIDYTIKRMPRLRRHMYIEYLDIGPRFRTANIAKGLIEKLLDVMKKEGIDTVYFHAEATKPHLNRMYGRIAKEAPHSKAITWLFDLFGANDIDRLRTYSITTEQLENVMRTL
ncbi:GNAT family N-acetyltransferase [Candidatus Kaiserbacteria bacterium]|nr:GNAT family N-acetyltransferase [Candidatus Kaiserbacteria bacterium]